jgi:hypothetical protein
MNLRTSASAPLSAYEQIFGKFDINRTPGTTWYQSAFKHHRNAPLGPQPSKVGMLFTANSLPLLQHLRQNTRATLVAKL